MTNLVYAMLAITAGVAATERAVRWFIPATALVYPDYGLAPPMRETL
jgi:hypothetical protein